MSRFEMNQIKGVIPAVMMFFDREENMDAECTRHMVELMLEYGADGFYLTGNTGECFIMTVEERNLMVDTVIDQVKGRVPIAVHVGDIGTKKPIELVEHAYRASADAVLFVPSFYWKFRVGDIYNYYRDISESTSLPMVVYNTQLTGLMDMSLFLRLVGLPNVHGLKYTVRSHGEIGFIKETLDPNSMIYSGCNEMVFSDICSGADGIIGSFYNSFPDLYKQTPKKMGESDTRRGTRLQRVMDEVIFAAPKYDFPPVLHNLTNQRDLKSGYPKRSFYNYWDSELEGLKEDIRKIKDRYRAEELDMFRL